jgi:hypothetical protein
MTTPLLAAILAAAVAQADPKTSPLDAVTASPADKPLTVVRTPVADEQVQRVLTLLSGQFESKAQGDQPALHIGAAVVPVEGVMGGRGVLMQISPLARPAEPVRVVLLHPYRRQGQLRLRVFDLVGAAGFKDAMAGLWAAPDAAPKLSLQTLTTSVDFPLSAEGEGGTEGFTGATERPFPTTRDGAIEMTSSLKVSSDALELGDAGFDADGKQVWGVRDAERIVFARSEAAKPKVQSSDEGLTVIILVPPEPNAATLETGGELTAHYTGWLTDGTRFDTSRQPGREPFVIRLPGPVIKGWNEGLKGIAVGERRRLIVPYPLAYGERGRGSIPPKATLIFDVECLKVNNQPPAGLTPPPIPPARPGGAGGAGGTGGSGGDGGAIGKPPTNSTPERPR